MPEPVPPDAVEFPYDAFVSYSSRDQAWVRGELLTRIEQAGLGIPRLRRLHARRASPSR